MARKSRATPSGSPSTNRTTLQVPETPNRHAARKVQEKTSIGIIEPQSIPDSQGDEEDTSSDPIPEPEQHLLPPTPSTGRMMNDAPVESDTESAEIREDELEELRSDLVDWIPAHNEPGAHWSHNHRWCRHGTWHNARGTMPKACFLAFKMHHTNFRAGAH